mmetsp:Transcript_3973/g.5182  ORF Transcript_3973/g.5182 Transcript_3973/m.5182 type:complete len:273 (-) Transcript_3973:40-858(-)
MGFLEGIKRFLPMTGNQIHFLISPFGLGLLSSSLALTFGASHVAWKLRNAIGDFLLDPEEIQRAKEKRERVLSFLTQMKDQTIEMRDAKTARKIHGSLKMYTPLKPTQKSVLVSIMSGVVTSALVFPIRTVVVRAVKDDKIFVWNLFKDMWATGQSPSWLYDGFLWSMAATFTALCVQQVSNQAVYDTYDFLDNLSTTQEDITEETLVQHNFKSIAKGILLPLVLSGIPTILSCLALQPRLDLELPEKKVSTLLNLLHHLNRLRPHLSFVEF